MPTSTSSTQAAVSDDSSPNQPHLTGATNMRAERLRGWRRAGWLLGGGVLLAWSSQVSDCSLSTLTADESLAGALSIAEGIGSPDLSPKHLSHVASLIAETFGIAGLGLALALLLAIPMALLAARVPGLTDPPGQSVLRSLVAGAAGGASRLVLTGLRAVPDIVWAYAFVRLLGLGPGPAVLAIGLSFAGIIGRLYAELLEAVDPRPLLALQASGASRWSILLFGALPQVRSQWLGYGLFRFECAIRSAAIVGVVGAGSLGAEIQLAVRYFEFEKLGTTLLALVLIIVALEMASGWLRKHVGWSAVLLGAMVVLGLVTLDVPWSDLFYAENWATAAGLLEGHGTSETAVGFWSQTVELVIETLGMAVFGTAVAALIAFLLAPWASYAVMVGGYLRDSGVGLRERLDRLGRNPGSLARLLLVGVFRALFQVLRAVPDLVWALIFVAWVGPGAFAGALAIAVHTTGLLGRLFGEVYSEASTEAAAALEANGVGRVGVWAFALLPDVRARLAAFVLFRLEVNLRATAVVGFVGAGGLGDAIHTALSLFHGADLVALLTVLFGLMVVVDALSGWLRQRLLAG